MIHRSISIQAAGFLRTVNSRKERCIHVRESSEPPKKVRRPLDILCRILPYFNTKINTQKIENEVKKQRRVDSFETQAFIITYFNFCMKQKLFPENDIIFHFKMHFFTKRVIIKI